MSGVVTGLQILTDGGQGMLGEGLLQGWVAAPEAFPGFQTSLWLSHIIPGVPNRPRHPQITPSIPRFPSPARGHIPDPPTAGFREGRKRRSRKRRG